MKSFLLVTICILFTNFSHAGDTSSHHDQSLHLGFGLGTYQQGALQGHNLTFSADYRINQQFSIGQISQFGFITTTALGKNISYVNQHISIVGMKHILDNRYFMVMAGAGLGYTNFHTVQIRKSPSFENGHAAASNPYMVSTQAGTQISFPLVLDAAFRVSKTVSIGVKIGTYIPAGPKTSFNFSFANPTLKFGL